MLTDFLGTSLPRLVAPLFPDIVWRGPARSEDGKPVIYLTFDDGPHPESTRSLLDFLEEVDARATFFLLGSRAQQRPDLVGAMLAGGHQIGNHGWTHRSAWKASSAKTLADFDRAHSLLEDLTGQTVQFVRPPYGRFTPALRRWCRDSNRRLVLWDLMPGDFLRKPADELALRASDQMTNRSRPGSIVVLHEGANGDTVAVPALRTALTEFATRGWVVGALPHGMG